MHKFKIGDECKIVFGYGFEKETAIILSEGEYDEDVYSYEDAEPLYWIKLKSHKNFRDIMPDIRGNNRDDGKIYLFAEGNLQFLKSVKKIIKPYGIVKFMEETQNGRKR